MNQKVRSLDQAGSRLTSRHVMTWGTLWCVILLVRLWIPPSWLGVCLSSPETEEVGEVELNLQCKKKKKNPW